MFKRDVIQDITAASLLSIFRGGTLQKGLL